MQVSLKRVAGVIKCISFVKVKDGTLINDVGSSMSGFASKVFRHLLFGGWDSGYETT